MNPKQNIKYDRDITGNAKAQESFVRVSKVIVRNNFNPLFQDFYEKVDDALFDLANNAVNNEEQSLYFDTLRILRKNRHEIADQFVNEFHQEYDQFWSGHHHEKKEKTLFQESENQQFCLVSNDELEEDIAIDDMVRKGEKQYQDTLLSIEYRLGYFFKQIKIASTINPFRPKKICAVFKNIIMPLQLDIKVKLVIYKLFDRYVISMLDKIYHQLLDQFEKQNISARQGMHPVYSSQSVMKNKVGSLAVKKESKVVTLNTLEKAGMIPSTKDESSIDKTISSVDEWADHSIVNSSIAQPQQMSESVIGVLNQMQSRPIIDNHDYINIDQIKCHVKDELKNIDNQYETTMDMIAVLFEFILENNHLPDELKAMISRLQIPMIKIALVDKTFFENRNHAARKLLFEIANSSIYWKDGKQSQEKLKLSINAILSRILEEFNQDIHIFEKALVEFQSLVKAIQVTHSEIDKKRDYVIHENEIKCAAKKAVINVLKMRLNTCKPSKPVRDFILSGWNHVMQKIHIQQGSKSDAWQQAVIVLDEILMSLNCQCGNTDKQKILESTPERLTLIKSMLLNHYSNKAKANQRFEEFQRYYISAMVAEDSENFKSDDESEQLDEEVPVLYESVVSDKKTMLNQPQQVDSEWIKKNDDVFNRQVKSLKRGDWLDFKFDDQHEAIRAKLHWITDTQHVFVNVKGGKLFEYTGVQLAEMLTAGIAMMAEDVSLLDKVWSNVTKVFSKSEFNAYEYVNHRF